MTIKLITAPTIEPVSADEAQEFLRATDDDANVIAGLIRSAREWAEGVTGRALCAQTRELVLDSWPCYIKIHCAPILTVESIKYKDVTGTETTLDAANYVADLDSIPARIVPVSAWPSVALLPVAAIRVQFTCGYSDSEAAEEAQQAAVPAQIKQVMLRRIEWQFDHRDYAQDQIEARSALVIPDMIDQALTNQLAQYLIRVF